MLSRLRFGLLRASAAASRATAARAGRVHRAAAAAATVSVRRALSTGGSGSLTSAAPADSRAPEKPVADASDGASQQPAAAAAAAAAADSGPRSTTFIDYFSYINEKTAPRHLSVEAVEDPAIAAQRQQQSATAGAEADADADDADAAAAAAPKTAARPPPPPELKDREFPARDESVSAFVARCPPHATRALYCCVLSTHKEHVRAYTQAEARPMEKVVDRILKVRHTLTSQKDLLSLARAVNLVNGKFVLTVAAGSAAADLWRRVALATHKGQLGVMASINTQLCLEVRGLPVTEHRIFVYTHSMFDAADKQRVRDRLAAIAPDAFGAHVKLHYKPDLYTYLGFEYDNPNVTADTTPEWVHRDML